MKSLRADMSFEEVIAATQWHAPKHYHTHHKEPSKPCYGCQLESLFSDMSAKAMRGLLRAKPRDE